MKLVLYPLLCTRSRRAFRRRKGHYGRNFYYQPRGTLIERLARETGQSKEWVYDRLLEERAYYLKATQAGAEPEPLIMGGIADL